jgi:putative transposase
MPHLTFKYRVKDAKSGRHLDSHARSVNAVWNYCCNAQRAAQRRYRAGGNAKWPTAFDLIGYCAGSSALLGIHSDTVAAVCRRFAQARNTKGGCPKFRASGGPRRALGWVPFVPRAVNLESAHMIYLKRKYRFWASRPTQGEFVSGTFSQDARGRWYIHVVCEVIASLPQGSGSVGIDLGLRALVACSNGEMISAPRYLRFHEAKLASAQRAKNSRRVRAIHAKIVNSRRHHLHVVSTRLVRENKFIAVGNVSPSRLARGKMAKSIYDAGWSTLRNQIRYKAMRHGSVYIEVDERFTSQTCSACGEVPASSPKGLGALGVRHWTCCACGASHNRDVNAAANILRAGAERCPPVVEIPILPGSR